MKAFLEAKRREEIQNRIGLVRIAAMAQTTPATVSRIVNGERAGRADTVVRIARAFTDLGCPIDAGRVLAESAA